MKGEWVVRENVFGEYKEFVPAGKLVVEGLIEKDLGLHLSKPSNLEGDD